MTFKIISLRHALLPMLMALLSTGAIFAHGDEEHGESKAKAAKKDESADTDYTCSMHSSVHAKQPGKCPTCGMALTAVHQEEHKAAAEAPTTDLQKTWAMVQEQHAALDHAIENKELAKVHEFAFAIRDLLKKMPALSSALSAEDRKKLDGAVERSAGIAAGLDESGDAGQQKATEEQEGRLDKLLHYIASLYPKGTLGAEDDHKEHGDANRKHE